MKRTMAHSVAEKKPVARAPMSDTETKAIVATAKRLIGLGCKPADAWAQAFRERSNASSPVRKLAESLIAAGVPEQAAWVRALARGGIHA